MEDDIEKGATVDAGSIAEDNKEEISSTDESCKEVEQDIEQQPSIDEAEIANTHIEQNTPVEIAENKYSPDVKLEDEKTMDIAVFPRATLTNRDEIVYNPRSLDPISTISRKLLPIYPEIPRQFPQKRERNLCIVRKRIKYLKRMSITVLLSMLIMPYLVGGAFLFSFLEEKPEMTHIEELSKLKNNTAILLATELRQVKANEPIWARYVFKYLDIFEDQLLEASGVGYWRKENMEGRKRWSLVNSFFYSLSLVTTTGYGSMTPKSYWGRTATICYSLLGLPVMLMWLISCGYFLALYWTWMFKSLCCQLCEIDDSKTTAKNPGNKRTMRKKKSILTKRNSIAPLNQNTTMTGFQINSEHNRIGTTHNSEEKMPIRCSKDAGTLEIYGRVHSYQTIGRAPKPNDIQKNIERRLNDLDHIVSTVFSLIFFLVYFVFGSAVFAITEDLLITDALYFNFLMFLTLGPGCYELKNDTAEIKIKQNVFYILFLLLGYCIISMILNLIVMFYNPASSEAMSKIKRTYQNDVKRKDINS